jgi:excisionase family DNA binding protein
MRFTAAELAEIRSAFHERIRTEPARKKLVRWKPKAEPLPPLVLEPDLEDGAVLLVGEVAERFDVSPRTIHRWADAGMLPVFRTLGGHRRFRWGSVRRAGL